MSYENIKVWRSHSHSGQPPLVLSFFHCEEFSSQNQPQFHLMGGFAYYSSRYVTGETLTALICANENYKSINPLLHPFILQFNQTQLPYKFHCILWFVNICLILRHQIWDTIFLPRCSFPAS